MTRPERIYRFTRTERLYHWAQALPFLSLLVSGGLILLERRLHHQWVPLEVLREVHQVSGIALPVAILLVFLGGDRRRLLHNGLSALKWRPSDLKWLMLFPIHNFFPSVRVPPAGKFNPGQKINLLAQMTMIPMFVGTGLLMWFYPGPLLPWYVHVIGFVLAVPLVAGHLFLALVNPATRIGLSGVFTGWVDGRWAREHYPLAYGAAEEPTREGAPVEVEAGKDR